MTDQQNGPTPAMVAVDWGGTWCRMALIDRQGVALWQERRRNPQGGDADAYLALGGTLLAEVFALKGFRPMGIGIAVAGPVDPVSGILYQPPNLMALDGVSLKRDWQERYDVPIVVGNDANLAAVGEYHFGAGREAVRAGQPIRSLFYVTVSTGIGGGVMEGGKLLLGANGLTAEVGHTTVDTAADAPRCQCGKRGCLEAVSSGTAIANFARSRLAAGGCDDSALAALAPEEITSGAVVAAAARGDAFANAVMDRAVEGLAVGLANAVHLFNPDLIILGGGVSQGLAQLDLLPRIKERIHERLMSELHKSFELVPSALGDNSGLLGAAAAAWEEV